ARHCHGKAEPGGQQDRGPLRGGAAAPGPLAPDGRRAGDRLPYKAGDDKLALQKKAETIRDEMRGRISHTANLMDPERFDTETPLGTYAQALVDRTLAAHPEVLILGMHVTPPNRSENVILASNIGRIGKT